MKPSSGIKLKSKEEVLPTTWCVMCVSGFVSYLAVDVIVAHPAGRDARWVSTLELTGAAGGRSALHLVGAVATVVLAVAHKVLGDAAAANARELIWSASDVTWRRWRKNVKGQWGPKKEKTKKHHTQNKPFYEIILIQFTILTIFSRTNPDPPFSFCGQVTKTRPEFIHCHFAKSRSDFFFFFSPTCPR